MIRKTSRGQPFAHEPCSRIACIVAVFHVNHSQINTVDWFKISFFLHIKSSYEINPEYF
jgi:hypothetical protein